MTGCTSGTEVDVMQMSGFKNMSEFLIMRNDRQHVVESEQQQVCVLRRHYTLACYKQIPKKERKCTV